VELCASQPERPTSPMAVSMRLEAKGPMRPAANAPVRENRVDTRRGHPALPEAHLWGGYSGYFADRDGYPLEVAYNSYWKLDAEGRVRAATQTRDQDGGRAKRNERRMAQDPYPVEGRFA
jgi:hypothetical protein